MKNSLADTVKRIFLFFGCVLRREYPFEFCLLPSPDFVDLMFDVGANIGQYAIELRNSGYKGLIISIEPLEYEHSVLSKISERDSNWIIEQRMLLGSTIGVGQINRSQNSFSSSVLPILQRHLDSAPNSNYIGAERVQMTTLDSLWLERYSKFERVGIKIDVQGFEMEVLMGAPIFLKNCVLIQIEMTVIPLYENQTLYFKTDEFLRKLGFVLWKIDTTFVDANSGQVLQLDAIYCRSSGKPQFNNQESGL
jgi:FkbM family methyltransferase